MVSSSSNSGNNIHTQHRMLGNEHSNSNSGNEKMSAMANNNMGGVAQDDMNGHTHDMHGMDHMDNHDHNNMNHDMSMMGSGTIMYMDGFHSALFHSTPESPPPCLNFLHPTWTLHTQSKFIFAMVCVTLMGMLVEACGVWRVKCLRKGRQFRKEERRKRLQIELQEEQHRQQQDNHLMNNSLISEITSETRTESFTRPTPSRNHNVCPAFLRRIWRCILPKCIRGICVSCFCRNSSEREVARTIRGWESAAAFLHALRALLGYALMLTVMVSKK